MNLTENSFDTMVETTQEVEIAPEYAETQVAETTETKTEETTEVKTEPTEVKTEVKTEVATEEKPKSLFDKFTKPTEVKEEVKTIEIPKELQNELDQAKAELQKYKESPIAKLLGGDYDLTKVDLKDFLSKGAGENYSNLSDEQLIEKNLTSNPHFSKLSAEDQEEEIENMKAKFEGMGKLEKIEAREAMISKMSTNPTDLFKTLTEIQEGQKALTNPDEYFEKRSIEQFNETRDRIKGEIGGIAKSLIGQEYNGYKVGEEDAKLIESAFDEQTTSFDTEKVAFNLFKAVTYDKAVEAAYERGKLEGVKEQSNPSKGTIKGTPIFKGEKKGLAGLSFEEFPTL
jgi:hypothetical protein